LHPRSGEERGGAMKRIFVSVFTIVMLALFFIFAIKNMDSVSVRYLMGFEWQAPLALVLLAFFALGVAGGIVASLGVIFMQRREILSLKRELRKPAKVAMPVVTGGA
jgi:putative membrane protein